MNVGGTTDRLMQLSRTMVGNFPGSLAQINVVLSIFFAGISGSSTADAASRSKIFIEAQTKEDYDLSWLHYGGLGRTRGDHPTIDPDDRVGRPAHRFDRGAVSCRHRAWPVDRIGADGNRTRLCQGARLPDLSAFVVARASLCQLDRHSGPDDPGDHRRRQDLRLVHGHRIGVHRRPLCRGVIFVRLPRHGSCRPAYRPARHRQACRHRALLRRHSANLSFSQPHACVCPPAPSLSQK